MKRILFLILIFILGLVIFLLSPEPTTKISFDQSPLAISAMKQKSYPGSNITIEETLTPGSNFNRYLVSYQSEGLKLYALLTVPMGQKPAGGWPVILFNHGYIPPTQYSTSDSYAVMANPLASAGYIVLKPDYRGNGLSAGQPTQVYISPDYVTDSMNAFASIKKYPDANPQKIGVFGHSMGGNITLHELVINSDIKAAEIMAGVVGDETGILNWWNDRIVRRVIIGNNLDAAHAFQKMIKDYGTPNSNPVFWNSIDPTQFISNISAPIQIQVGTADEEVPPQFSSFLHDKLKNANKNVDYIEYPGAEHNLLPDQQTALQKSIEFFDKYLK